MAEVDVKKQTGEPQRSQSPERQRQSELQRRGPYSSLFPANPSELFNLNPFALMRRFTEEMDRAFQSVSGRREESALWSPAVEVSEHDGKIEVVADLPGVKENDVKVEVTDEGLVIQGERRREHEEKGEGFYRSERTYGQFYRLIPLPEGANLDQARAEFRNGELRVGIPVPEQQRKVRQIPISSSPAERKEAMSQAASGQQGQGRRAG
ncbi:MAG TPA: Hsp20/alpha crystallin family protein [Bryobacteraceae bacterium]|nr:Hsp20/alpha crystallin family protein [Bryobacteraceae bacterium]